MGCCQSSGQDDEDDYRGYGGQSETGPLLGRRDGDQSQQSGAPDNGQQWSDGQSALSRILQETSNHLIDINAQTQPADVMEETDAQYRAKQYSSRLRSVTVPSESRLGPSKPKPLNILAEPCLSASDLDLVTQAAQRTAQCMSNVEVQHREDLIVQFAVP